MPLSADRCEHFSLTIGSFRLPADLNPVRVPVESCDLCAAMVGRAEEAMPALVYGPDGRLVTRSLCTGDRRDGQCLPALASTPAALAAARAAKMRSTRLGSEVHRVCDQAGMLTQQARSRVARAARLVEHVRAQRQGRRRSQPGDSAPRPA